MTDLTSRLRALPLSVITDSAAALTYFMVLSLFPGIALVIAAAALIAGEGTADSVVEIINAVAPRSVAVTFDEPVHSLATDDRLSGIVFVVSLGIALFMASRYVAAFGRAADRIQGGLRLDAGRLNLGVIFGDILDIDFKGRVVTRGSFARLDLETLWLNDRAVQPMVLDMVLKAASMYYGQEVSGLEDWYALPRGVDRVRVDKGKAVLFYR